MAENIKSSFINKAIFKFIDEKRKLKIVKYNKKLQNKINISILNYKIFSGGRYIIYETKEKIKELNAYNNHLLYEGGFLNGKRNGEGKEYFDNGQLKFEGKYLNGKRNGNGKEYYENGKLKFEGVYLDNKKLNGYLYDLIDHCTYRLEKGEGSRKEFYENGNLEFEGEYIDGERQGKGKEY